MSVAATALRHGRGLVLVFSGAAVAGLLVAQRLPKAVYPEVSFPREQVVATAPGGSAQVIEVSVTRPLEAGLASVPGVQRIRSRTIRGAAEISLFFAPDTDMAQAHQLVLARLAEARQAVPQDVELTAERVLPSGFPILSFNVEGPYPPERLYELAEYTLRPALSGLPGVGRVWTQASETPEVEVLLDPSRLAAAHLTVGQVAARLKGANDVQSVARLDQEHQLALGVVTGALQRSEQLTQVVVGGTEQSPVRLGDLGRVVEGTPPRTRVVRVDGQPGVILNVARRLGGDILVLDAAARAKLAQLSPSLPPGISIRPVYEQADFVRDAVSGVRDALLFGALFAVLVLAFFLRDWRATLVAALSLPLTLSTALLVLAAFGQTINLMTLGGLAVAVGLVIDDAVVVVEAVHAKLEAGLPPAEAARAGTDELLWPVVGTTLTTIVVFLPLGLLSGVAGQFFAALSLALAAAVLISMPVALLVLPPIAARFLRPFRGRAMGRALADRYGGLLERSLSHGAWMVAAAVLLIAVAGVLAARLPSDFLPEADEGAYVIDYYAPVGASLDEADRLAARIEQVLRKTPEVAAFSRRLGSELGPPTATLSSRGDIAIRLKTDRDRDVEEIMDQQREQIAAAAPGLRVEFSQVLADMLGDLEGSPEPLELKIYGPEVGMLRSLAAEASRRIHDLPGLVDAFNGDEGCAPEELVRVDPLRAGYQGLDATSVADQLEGDYMGQVATQLRRPDHLEDVRVRLDGPETTAIDTFGASRVTSGSGALVPLGAIAELEPTCEPAQLLRENQRNYVHVTGRLSGTSLGSAAREVRRRLADWHLPLGYTWELGGLIEQQQASLRSLLRVLGIALFLVAAILVFQLRSFRSTLAVLLAAPVALAGGLITLAVTGVSLNVASGMGAILLIGLVVKNGILLLEHAHRSHEAGRVWREAVVDAGRARIRPILMTTLATLVALLPLVLGIGAGSALHRPLAVMVLGGLFFSTAATLFVVPAWVATRRARRSSPGGPGVLHG